MLVKVNDCILVLIVLALDADLKPFARLYAFAGLMWIKVNDMRVARRGFDGLGPIINHEVLARHHVATVARADCVVIGLAKHAAENGQHEQQPVGVLLPAVHLVKQLPCHVRGDTVGTGTLYALGVRPKHAALDEVCAVYDHRIGTGLKLHRRNGQERVTIVRRIRPRE